jgi:glycosyltransferase involved in cell wall biosynthesis
MRVAVVSDMLRPTGANIMAATCAALLSSRGHEVTLLSGSGADPSIRSLLEGIRVNALLTDDHVLDRTKGVQRTELSQAAEAWVHRQLAEARPDVVVCHNTGRLLDQVAVARLSQSHPVAVVLHDEWFLTDQHYVTEPTAPTLRLFEPFRATSAREHDFAHLWHVPTTAGRLVAISPSSWLQQRWRQVFPTLPCALVHNPIDDAVFEPVAREDARKKLGLPGDGDVVGFVGDPLSKRKGLDLLLSAISTLPPERRPTVLVAGGKASWAGRQVKERIADGGLLADRLRASSSSTRSPWANPDMVVVAGVGRPDFKHVYAAMDLLVHPSQVENLPTVPIEAAYCGTPVLVSDVGGSRDTVADAKELFDRTLSPSALGTRIADGLEVARHRSLGERQERASAARARFSPDVHYAQLLPVLERLVS